MTNAQRARALRQHARAYLRHYSGEPQDNWLLQRAKQLRKQADEIERGAK